MSLQILGENAVGVGSPGSGQYRPGAATISLLYQVPANSHTIGNLIACNTDAANDDYIAIYVIPGGTGTPTIANAIFNDVIPYQSSFVAVVGLSLGPLDSVYVVSTNGRVTFTFSGDNS